MYKCKPIWNLSWSAVNSQAFSFEECVEKQQSSNIIVAVVPPTHCFLLIWYWYYMYSSFIEKNLTPETCLEHKQSRQRNSSSLWQKIVNIMERRNLVELVALFQRKNNTIIVTGDRHEGDLVGEYSSKLSGSCWYMSVEAYLFHLHYLLFHQKSWQMTAYSSYHITPVT